ncbi:MAG TPA: hypothetical protein VF406_14005 [Thermodesulfobacteriota bacterium]
MVSLVHHTGPVVDGVQRCLRCGTVLADGRHTVTVGGAPALAGFAPDTLVGVIDGPFRSLYVIAGRLPDPDEPLCAPAGGPWGEP